MIELNKIYNEDCLEGMKRIPDGSVDCIVCDLPYGVLNKGNEKAQWDNIIPMEPLFKEYWRIAKPNAPVILFCQGMFTAQLMMAEPKTWRYNLIWQKDRDLQAFSMRSVCLCEATKTLPYSIVPCLHSIHKCAKVFLLIQEDTSTASKKATLVMAATISRLIQRK